MSRAEEPLLVLVGPTASGKSDLALRLAQQIGAEIVSADSVQVYRRFDLGSAKPGPEERALVPHHLIDVVNPLDAMDAARWALLADQAIAELHGRGRHALVCGGTFLWVRALLEGLAAAPPADPELRERHRKLALEQGRSALHAELARVDPVAAQRLAPNDLMRVSRALEVHQLTGRPLSSWQAEHGFRETRHAALLVGIRYLPAELDRRITVRVHHMLERGLVEEVRSLLLAGFAEARAMRSVGYRQVSNWLLEGKSVDRESLAVEIVRATRVFARRQRTWLRDRPVLWLDPEEARTLPAAVLLERARALA